MRKILRDESGMTLLELMFAAGVLAMTLSFLFGSLVTITTAGDATASRSVATTHLTSVAEELRGLAYTQLVTYTAPTFTNPLRNEVVRVSCLTADGTLLALPTSPALAQKAFGLTIPNPLTVQCKITWNDSKGHALTKTISQQYRR